MAIDIQTLQGKVSDHLDEQNRYREEMQEFQEEKAKLEALSNMGMDSEESIQASIESIMDDFQRIEEGLDERGSELEAEKEGLITEISAEKAKTVTARDTASKLSKKTYGSSADSIVLEANEIIKEHDELLDQLDAGEGVSETSAEYPPNSIVIIDKQRFRTDDDGQIHMKRGEDGQYNVLPNKVYTVKGYTYTTDDKSRITSASGVLRVRSGDRQSLNSVVKDMKPGDQRGHIFADLFEASNQNDNLVAQLSTLNQGEYKMLEEKLANYCRENHEVRCTVSLLYDDDTSRPCMFTVQYTVDNGEVQRYDFFNYEE